MSYCFNLKENAAVTHKTKHFFDPILVYFPQKHEFEYKCTYKQVCINY